jgi:hypothetical protein
VRGALAIGLVALSAAAARADGVYLSDQLGMTTFHGGAARAAFGDTGADLRSALGLRIGQVAVELWLGGDLPVDESVAYKEGLPGYGVDAKYFVPIVRGHGRARAELSAYGMLELRSVWLGDPSQDQGGGRGIGGALGLSFAGTIYAPSGYLSTHGVRFGVWIERGADWLRVARSPDAPALMPLVTGAPGAPAASSAWDVRADHWVLGFGFGGDV